MTERHHPDPAERLALDELDAVVSELLTRYMERRDAGVTPAAHDLLAAAAEFGPDAVQLLRAGMAFYELMRETERA
jgi:hypothetical protein